MRAKTSQGKMNVYLNGLLVYMTSPSQKKQKKKVDCLIQLFLIYIYVDIVRSNIKSYKANNCKGINSLLLSILMSRFGKI